MALAALVVSLATLGPAAVVEPVASASIPVVPASPTPSPSPAPTRAPDEPKRHPARYPSPPRGSGAGRRIVYSVPKQRMWLLDSRQRVLGSWLVSGHEGVPHSGSYQVFSRSRYTSSGSWRMEYMVRFAHGRSKAIGFHSIPVDGNGRPVQRESDLGTYRSHGCVRQRKSDAAKTWDFAPVGTRVVVTS